MNRITIKEKSKSQIKGKMGILFLFTLILCLAVVLADFVPFSAFLVLPPFSLGFTAIYLKISKEENVEIANIFDGFYDLWSSIKVNFFVSVFTFLWSLLFLIPGIVKAISYSQAYFILAENPNMNALEVIDLSKQMMEGHKADYFVFILSFFGWFLLIPLTFGLASIYVIPYFCTSLTNFYAELKNEA